MYGFNPLTPLNLLPLLNPQDFAHNEGVTKAKFVKKMHDKIKNKIQQQTEKYRKHSNKGNREVSFRREIGFGFTLEKIDSLIRGSLNLVHGVMVPSKFSKESIIMHIKLTCLKNMEYILTSMLWI